MNNISKLLKMFADTNTLRAVGDISSILDGYLELESREKCTFARKLANYAEALIFQIKQSRMSEKEDSSNDSKH